VWIEGVGGVGVTGRDIVPVVELGTGFSLPVGTLEIGPSVRYMRLAHSPSGSNKDPMSLGTAELVLAGVDVRFGVERAPRRRVARAHVAAAHVMSPPEPTERDADAIVERETSCAEVLDGCPLSEDIVIRDSRIVLSERVLFDFDKVRVHSRGRAVIAEITRLWKAHPEWKHLTIEGHTDAQGDKSYNQDLSERRAHKVREVMIASGADPDAVDAVGFGQTRLRTLATDLDSHGLNRRVEFVIDQRVPRGDDK
jgi:outer membrane protein OmpA-like peptidoglycan-associated protein